MPTAWRDGGYVGITYITGPQILTLMLDLQPERLGDPFVTARQVCRLYGNPSDDVVRAAVLAGTDDANPALSGNRHPLEISYSYSGWDTEHCNFMRWAAYASVEAVVTGTVADGP